MTVRTEVTVDECLDRRRQLMPDEISVAASMYVGMQCAIEIQRAA